MDSDLYPKRDFVVSRYAEKVAAAIVEARCVKLSAQLAFAYALGDKGPVYCDMDSLGAYKPPSRTDTNPWESVTRLLPLAFIDAKRLYGEVDAVAAVATGGISFAAHIATQANIPWFTLVTKKPEAIKPTGFDVRGMRVAVVEDVVRTGLTGAYHGATMLREAGAITPFVFGVVDYQFKETHNIFRRADIGLFGMTYIPTIVAQMKRAFEAKDTSLAEDGEATPATVAVIEDWYAKQGGLATLMV